MVSEGRSPNLQRKKIPKEPIINDPKTLEKLDDIRVTYSGLLGLAVSMGGMFAGLGFTIIVTRQLSPEEFGVWTIISSMIAYSVIAETVVSYWTTRQVARGTPVAKTSVVSSSLFAGGSIPVYLLSIHLFATNIEPVFFDSMLLGAILIPVMFIHYTLSAINFGHKPHALSIGTAIYQALKIPAGFVLVFSLGLGIEGAILTLFAAQTVNLVIQLRYALPYLRVSLNVSYMRGWIRQSWLPLYTNIPSVLRVLDIILYTMITGSVIGAAYFAAASVISRVVARAGIASQAIYPKLLAKGSQDHLTENMALMMYFAIPLLTLTTLFSYHIMFLLNAEYAIAWVAGVLLSVAAFLQTINNFIRQVLAGIDDVDVVENPSLSALLKSKLFHLGTLENFYYAVYLAILVVFLYMFMGQSDMQLVLVWSSILLSVTVPYLLYHVILIRRHAPFRVPYRRILCYMGGVAGMVVAFLVTNDTIIVFDESIYVYLPRLLIEVAICGAVYLGITFAIDHKTRRLIKLILLELTSRTKQ